MSFQQGLSGLNAAAKNLDVIGNNIANAGTYGAKSSRAEFKEVYAGALGGGQGSPIGIGVTLSTVAQQFTQGNVTATDNPMDLAINGGGFFQVGDGKNPVSYTRNGQFKVSQEGYIVNGEGLKLLGYPADTAGVIQPGLAQTLRLPTSGISPQPTTAVKMEFNLDSRASFSGKTADPGINLKDAKTYNNATSMTAYDAKGQSVAVTFYFQKAQPLTGPLSSDPTIPLDPLETTKWNVFATANGEFFTKGADGNPSTITPADPAAVPPTVARMVSPYTTLEFDPKGGKPIVPTKELPLYIPATGNTLEIVGASLNMLGASENGSGFGVTNLTQDGYAPAQLTGIVIEGTGTVTARYSNGQSKPAGQVELANFINPQGLQPLGGNRWARTLTSGEAVVGVAGDGNLGRIQAGALEESNIDLTAELVNMVTAQRAYQASAQTIKTQDQVLQTIVNLR
ncbi:flagellar hook protein FlgE [Roseateles oligotrophus]|uniref:Flagellar hook protein FlgE n=1 Tax=Roseateles oligotrophus TaxID=1769250 RepID=A0ABT2YAQ4_9BURK|nr:flagellar hook protein FlgE [Roseateles oligotrophus]MCV2367374.1 flagellar hook protein FlgE [Roseateles oligotrophus]